MATHVVAPVKNILKSLEVGIKLAKRTARAADLASRDQALQIFESARSLQSSLERTSRAICDAYEQSAEVCGEPFARALLENSVRTSTRSQTPSNRMHLRVSTRKPKGVETGVWACSQNYAINTSITYSINSQDSTRWKMFTGSKI
ncbi:hypothetical protein M7I_1809 [Glarea lozoyensis 74030]|uniref:Uncharacterized protein n=1 Tax=Glarea lozoyensis (strain ATCC 74030 / MF5533) TaxID=1104152 RepID=H0EGV1_GLAL7|nr:hypothetical protein M7I_1809 [Glarea lozoyensis 74030]